MNTKVMTLVKRITLIVLGVALLLSAGLVFLTSYTSWNDYYKQMLIKKERFDKEQEPEVTVMNGIRVTVKDGVGFFKNGKASAKKTNFVVEGLYTVGNEINKRDYEEELSASDYTLTVPEDFAQNGGELKFNFKTEEEKVDENGETVYVKGDKDKGDKVDKDGYKLDEKGNKIPVMVTVYDFTETMNIELVDIKLDHIEVTKNPYLVAYAEGEKFVSEGMTVNAVYNDGSKIENLAVSLLDISKEALTTEDKSVKLTYKYGEAEDEVIYGEVPVTVMTKDEFTNGELKDLYIVGDISLKVGEGVSDLNPQVYASYSSGNYVKLNSNEYGITGFNGTAEFGKKYSVVVYSLKNPDVNVRKTLYPVDFMAADEAVLNGATAYDGYVKDFDSGDYIEFVYTSATAGVIDLYLNMSNGYIFYENGAFMTKQINLGDFAYVSMNGKLKELNHVFEARGPFVYSSEALSLYEKISLGTYVVKAGENTIRINFKESNSDAVAEYGQYVAGAIEGLEVAVKSTSDYLGDYVAACTKNSVAPSFTVTQEIGWGTLGAPAGVSAWTYATATDGEYLFFYVNTIGAGDNLIGKDGAVIVKYDIKARKTVAYTTKINYSGEASTPFFIRDGYLYSMAANGTFMRIPTSFTGNGTAKPEYVPSLKMKNEAGDIINKPIIGDNGQVSVTIKAVYYNQSLRKYAVLSGNNILLLASDGSFESFFEIKNSENGAGLAKITGDENYIYGIYKKDGLVNPVMTIYDWSGNYIGSINPSNSGEIMGYEKTGSTNVQSAAVVDGAFYFTMLCWEGGHRSSVYKVAFGGDSGNTTIREAMDLYEYVTECEKQGVAPSYTKTSLGKAPGTLGTCEGMTTDGTYIYIASRNDQKSVVITKHEIATGKLVGKTAAFLRGAEWNNGEYMTYMNGYVYVALDSGAIRRIATDEITADGTAEVENYSLSVSGLSGKVTGFAYNSIVNKLAVTAGEKIYTVGVKSMKAEASVDCASKGRVGSACDSSSNYIYVLFEKNNAYGTALINVYDWSGKLVKSGVEIPNLIKDKDSNNVQSMCVVDGNYYFLVSRWGNGGEIVKVTFDTSVLK